MFWTFLLQFPKSAEKCWINIWFYNLNIPQQTCDSALQVYPGQSPRPLLPSTNSYEPAVSPVMGHHPHQVLAGDIKAAE